MRVCLGEFGGNVTLIFNFSTLTLQSGLLSGFEMEDECREKGNSGVKFQKFQKLLDTLSILKTPAKWGQFMKSAPNLKNLTQFLSKSLKCVKKSYRFLAIFNLKFLQ